VDHDRLYVLDGQGAYIGAVSLGEIKRFIRESANLDWVIAADILDSSFPSVCLDEPLARAVEILSETDAERLPVLENPTSRRLVGSVSKRRLLAVYREMNLARGPVELGR
jgi:CIC family chloride channel protein